MAATVSVSDFISNINSTYEKLHKEFEDNFWATKMNLKGNSVDELTKTKLAYDNFLSDPKYLIETRELLERKDISEEERKVLDIFKRTFGSYTVPPEHADVVKPLKEKLINLEGALEAKAGSFPWTYVDEEGVEQKVTRKALFALLRANESEAVRKSCWETIEKFPAYIADDFAEVVKLRNKIAHTLGYKNYYDYKVTQAEGFNQERLFGILDDLEAKTRVLNQKAMKRLAEEKGADALKPWNVGFMAGGGLAAKLTDKYFPFEHAVDVWARTFAALGIDYQGATMRLDLCDRHGKYPNGFCHWPQVAWVKPGGEWQPSRANFTSLASPNVAGSGSEALTTLLHEGGHAAHFANIKQPSPLFAQERAPMSVAYAENQSMVLDSLHEDSDWRAKYALSVDGEVLPWSVQEACIKEAHPYAVRGLRRMLAVCYYEKAVYDLPEAEVTGATLQSLCASSDGSVMGEWQSMPTLLIPHLLSDESSAYYHGYVLAEMSVHHTRAYFERAFGRFADEPRVGKALTEGYWRAGNSEMFLDLVEKLTGSPLGPDAWVGELSQSLEDKLAAEKALYERGLKEGAAVPRGDARVESLNMRVQLVHGDEVVADTELDGGLAKACAKFEAWVQKTYPPKAESPAKTA